MTRLAVALDDASAHDVASRSTIAQRVDDLGTKMFGVVGQRLGTGDAGDSQGAGNGHEQRKTANEIESFPWGGGA
jgi:hypothetical protein